MMDFLVYEGKVAVALLVFYLFYRFLLRKETFHRFNRIVLVGTAVLSFVLPLCIITVRRPLPDVAEAYAGSVGAGAASGPLAATTTPWWHTALIFIYFAGVAFVLVRIVVSILSIIRIIRQGTKTIEEDGCKVAVTEEDIDPFSWMRYIVMSKEDWEGPRRTILVHEKAHIRFGHSVDLLLVDILSSLQWFNPAIWMLRSDLQELHEYEADDAVLRGGVNIRNYQFLLIRKAVGKSVYSVANNFNHSLLKNRIAMMCKPVSPRVRGFRALYLLPLVCMGLCLQAQTVYMTDGNSGDDEGFVLYAKDGNEPLFILRQYWGSEQEISRDEFNNLDQMRIHSMVVMKDTSAIRKYGEKAADGAVVITLKRPQDLNEIVVVRHAEKDDGPYPFFIANPETMPTFQGEDRNAFCRWLNARIRIPESCHHTGTMKVGFVVGSDGVVRDVEIQEGVCEELDAMILSLVSASLKWEPATSGGKPIMQYLTIPIVFTQR